VAHRPSAPDEALRSPPPAEPPRPGIFRTLPGRLFLLSSALLAGLFALHQVVAFPEIVELFRRVVSVACLGALAWLAILAVSRNRRAFLWRVRRKLILSYVFLGIVPLILVVAFVVTGGMLLYMTVASYVFRENMADLIEDIAQIAETSAIEIGRSPSAVQPALERKYANLSSQYPRLSIVALPVEPRPAAGNGAVSVGPWEHTDPPRAVPTWVTLARRFAGTLVAPAAATPEVPRLLMRAAVLTSDGRRAVVADLPVDEGIIERLRTRTGIRLGGISAEGCGAVSATAAPVRGLRSLFRDAVASMDCTNWTDGTVGALWLGLEAPAADLTRHLASFSGSQMALRTAPAPLAGGDMWWVAFVTLLIVLGGLFLVIQASALVVGGVLVKSITSAVHELFVGTERIQQGDFAHRISIASRDQLGDLADSFNRMSASIDHLLHVQREKQRLDDELRIAREIQKSLLPVRPPLVPGLDIADLCEPAREVGGDYYDFFQVGPGQLAVLIADVSGKGTSAALYMAELKGLMLALSHAERSPRRLLVDVNRLLADHLDNRSFITMTYALIDLDRQTMTWARAGHTPLIVVSRDRSEVIAPNGMVLGLRLPGAAERFEAMLDEHTAPLLPGDVIVLYTDGITEAMDPAGNLFGDAALARIVASERDRDAAGIRERVVRDVRGFVGSAEPHDDMTMIVIKVAGGA
jgi:serine phosphatase RsbU (regulator of sigma subunit)